LVVRVLGRGAAGDLPVTTFFFLVTVFCLSSLAFEAFGSDQDVGWRFG
jgi:hypothetical protein